MTDVYIDRQQFVELLREIISLSKVVLEIAENTDRQEYQDFKKILTDLFNKIAEMEKNNKKYIFQTSYETGMIVETKEVLK